MCTRIWWVRPVSKLAFRQGHRTQPLEDAVVGHRMFAFFPIGIDRLDLAVAAVPADVPFDGAVGFQISPDEGV